MKKWTKVLSSFVVATVMSTGLAAVAGCDSCDGDNGGHQHSYTWVDNGDGTHTGTCGVDGCDAPEIKNEAHAWDADDTCGKCDAVKTPEPVGKVTVTFNTNGGTAVAAQTIDKGGKVTAVTTTKTGYTFEGWYEKADLSGSPVNLATKTFDADVTLHAKWKEEGGTVTPDTEFTVTFDLDGGEGEFPAIKVKNGGKVTKPATEPTKQNFVFVGWVDELNIDFDFENTPVNSDITIKAKWRAESQFDKLSAREDNLISEDFSTKTKDDIGVHGGVYGNKGIYVDVDKAYDVAGGALTIGAESGGGNIGAIVDFGIVSGTVEGYFEFTMKGNPPGTSNPAYNNVNFYNQGSKVVEIMAMSTGSFRFTINGTVVEADTAVPCVPDAVNGVEFKFDLSAKTLTLKINGKAVFTDKADVTDAITGFTVMTSNSGKRPNTIDNIAVCGTAVSLADYKTALAGKLDAKFTKMTEGEGATHAGDDAKADLTVALNGGKGAINAETVTDHVMAYDAYNGAVKAMDLVAGDVQQGAFKWINANYPAADYTQNKAAYDKALKAVVDETDPAKLTVPGEGVEAGETLKAFITAMEGIKGDQTLFEEYAQARFEALLKEFNYDNYKINSEEYMAAMQLGDDSIFENVKDYDSYADAIATIDRVIETKRTALEAIDDDATMIAKQAALAKADFDAKVAELLADVTDEAVIEAINVAKDAVTAEILAEGVLEGDFTNSESAEYYVTFISAAKDSAIAKIREQLEIAGLTLEQAIEKVNGDFEAHKTAQLAKVKDATFAEELKNHENAPVLDLAECDTAAKVLAKYNETLTVYDTWLTVQLEEKTYTVSVNGTVIEGLTVIYGEALDVTAIGDPFGDNEMIDPDDGNLYADAEFTAKYEASAVYGNVEVFFRTVSAVKFNDVHSFDWSKIDKTTADKAALLSLTGVNEFIRPIIYESKDQQGNPTNTSRVQYRTDTDAGLVSGYSGGIIQCVANSDTPDAFTVTLSGTGTFAVAVRGGGNTTYTTFYLKDSKGNKLVAKYNAKAENSDFSEADNVYTMYSKTYQVYTFDIAESGAYTFCVTNGTCRIGSLVVTDNYKAPAVVATGIDITKDGAPVTEKVTIEGKSLQLGYALTSENGTEPNDVDLSTLAWSVVTGNEAVSVDENGLVTVIGAGSAQIKVSVTKRDGTTVLEKTVNVKVEEKSATAITLDHEALSLFVNDDFELNATPNGTQYTGITWTVICEDGVVATDMTDFEGDDTYGRGSALKEGTFTIRASLDGTDAYAECVVTVSVKTAVTYTYTHGDKADGSTVWNKNSAGSNTTADGVAGTKIDAAHPLTLTLSGSAKKATIDMKGFTTSTSNAMAYVQIILKDAAGNVVKTISGTTPTGKALGDFTFDGKTTLEITSETAFATIEIAHDGNTYSGKHFSITSLTVTAE